MAHLATLVFASLVIVTTGMFNFPGGSYPGGVSSSQPGTYPRSSGITPPASGNRYPASPPSYYPPPPRYYPPPPPPPPKALDALDKLWERINDVTSQNKFALEQFDALLARTSLIKDFVDHLELVVFPGLLQIDVNHNNDLDNLDDHLDELEHSLNELENATSSLFISNNQNADRVQNMSNSVASARRLDVTQQGQIADLHVAVKDFKSKLFTVMGNEFEFFSDKVEVSAGKLKDTQTRADTRLCEVGSVTLSAEDRVAEYVFQTEFDDVPGILYSISGLNWNLDARPDPVPHGYGPPPTEPNSAGVLVINYATTKSVKFQSYDLSFGDSQAMTVDVHFQACLIGPGTG